MICRLGRAAALWPTGSGVAKRFSSLNSRDGTEELRIVEEYYEMKAKEKASKENKQTSFRHRIISEKNLFTQEQKANTRKLVKAEFDRFLGRAKYMPVIDDLHLNTFAKALLSLESLEGIDSDNQLPGLVDLVFDRMHTVANFEPFINLVEVIFKHKVQVSENSKYLLIVTGTGWATRIETRQQIAFLALFPPDQQPAFHELFKNYESIFVERFTKDLDSKNAADFVNLIEILKVYRRANYGTRGSRQRTRASWRTWKTSSETTWTACSPSCSSASSCTSCRP